ncbi:hypothetical protein [Pseudonocardia sp.]|uniref:hypothetical protein n=1 Tax=Pseudonocardia sp. TaxID=60912 RepID=UPI00261AD409|nr:hypothetical protein [Pseudonocardia sp.]
MTVLVWILGGAGLWAVAAAVLSFVLGRVIGRAQAEDDSYEALRATRPAPESVVAPAVDPATAPIPLAMPRQRAVPPAPAMPRIPQPRPQPQPRSPAERAVPPG